MSALSESIARSKMKPKSHYRRRHLTNAIMLSLTGLFTLLALVPLVWIIIYVVQAGGPYINADLFTKLPALLGQSGGVSNAIQSTIIVTLFASILSLPIGVLTAFYVARNPNTPLGLAVRFGTDVLSGVPSIVIGLFGYAVIVLPQGHYSAVAGGIAIAIVMLPTIIRTTEEMLKLVPSSMREGSLALGAPEWKTSLRVMLPAAVTGVVTGFMLAVARGVGETAPLLFTVLGNDRFDLGQIVSSGKPIGQVIDQVMGQPVDGLTLTMWKYSQQPNPERVHQAWAAALVLMLFVLIVNVLARVLTSRRQLQGNR